MSAHHPAVSPERGKRSQFFFRSLPTALRYLAAAPSHLRGTYLPLTFTHFYLTSSVFPFDAPPAQSATLQMDGAGEL